METSNSSDTNLLHEVNDEKVATMTPVIVILVLLMLMGICGNVLVCYFYVKKSKHTTNTVFIIAVAVYDLIVCAVCIPNEIVELNLSYLYTSSPACKVRGFLNTFGAIGSVVTLLTIAVDRYRKICKPLLRQITLKEARLLIAASVFVSMFTSWPSLVLYRAQPIEIVTDDGIKLHGFDCTTNRDYAYKKYVWVYNAFLALGFITISTVLIIIYSLVGRVIFKKKVTQQVHSHTAIADNSTGHPIDLPEPRSEDIGQSNIENVEIHDNTMNSVPSSSDSIHPSVCNVSDGSSHTGSFSTGLGNTQTGTNTDQSHTGHHIDLRFTHMMLVITAVFIFSFLPYLIVSIWLVFQSKYVEESLSDTVQIVINIAYRSFFLNSVVNPLIYGFYNPKCRQYFHEKFCRCRNMYGKARFK